MARSRNIKPSFFANEILGEIDPLTRILFMGLWCLADREGRLEDRPKKIKIQVMPYDDCDVDNELNVLSKNEFIQRYEIDGKKYIQITNFLKHQNPHHKEVASVIPPPEGVRAISKETYSVSEQIRSNIFNRDGNKCLCCGADSNLTIDHIIPLSKDGGNEEENLQTLCKSCNSSKKDNCIDYRKPLNKSIASNEQPMHESSMSHEQVNNDGSCPTDSLNLIPDSPILIPESGAQQVAPSPSEPEIIALDKKGSRLPENWQLGESNYQYAVSRGLNHQEILDEATKFKNYWLSKSGKDATKKSWDMTWQNWILNDLKWNKPKQVKPIIHDDFSNKDYGQGVSAL